MKRIRFVIQQVAEMLYKMREALLVKNTEVLETKRQGTYIVLAAE